MIRILISTSTVLWVIFMMGVAAPAPAADIQGVYFSDRLHIESHHLTIRGTGLFRYLGLFHAYVGALYVDEPSPTADVLGDTAKRLELEYFHRIKGEDFAAATRKLLTRNLAPDTFARLKNDIDRFNDLYEDVQPGDRYALTYIPGVGTELALNGRPVDRVKGVELATALFSMWIGRQPMNASFKRQLLGLQ